MQQAADPLPTWADALLANSADLADRHGLPCLPPLAFRRQPIVVVGVSGRPDWAATKWLARHHDLAPTDSPPDRRARLQDMDWYSSRLRNLAGQAEADPPVVVRVAVDPYERAVDGFLRSLRDPQIRASLDMPDRYSFADYLIGLEHNRGHLGEFAAAQFSALDLLSHRLEIVRLEDGPAAWRALDARLGLSDADAPIDERRPSTNPDHGVARETFTTTDQSFVAPRAAAFYDAGTTELVDDLYRFDFDRLGYARRPPGQAGGPPATRPPALPVERLPLPPQTPIATYQSFRREVLNLSLAELGERYGIPGMRPLFFRHHDLVLLLAGRAASTFGVQWWAHHGGIHLEAGRFPHFARTDAYQTEWHQNRIDAALRGDTEAPVLRITRDPYRRAVSSYLHSLSNERPRQSVARVLDLDLATTYSFVDYLRAMEQLVPVGGGDEHGYLQFHALDLIRPLDAVYRVEDGTDRLREIERRFGLSETSDDLIDQLSRSGHQATYLPTDGFVGDVAFPLSPGQATSSPRARWFYDDVTKALVDEIYETDFTRFGYPFRPVGEAGA